MRPLRVGILDCAVGRAYYGAALIACPSVQVTAIVDPDARLARAWARELGGAISVFASLDALLESDTPCDAALITAPLQERTSILARMVRAGKAVLCPAPFALRLPQTDAVLRLAAEQSVLLMPALPRRLDADFQQAARIMEAQSAGALRLARCDWSFPVSGVATVETGADPEDEDWRSLLLAFACQTADVCRGWLGEAQTVSADIEGLQTDGSARALVGQRRRGEALANLIVTHERGQSTHQLACTRAVQSGERYTLTGATGRLELVVSAGTAAASPTTPTLTLHRPGHRPENLRADSADSALPPPAARLQRLLEHFAACVLTDCAPQVTGQDARAAQEIVRAAFLSARDGAKASLPLRPAADTNG